MNRPKRKEGISLEYLVQRARQGDVQAFVELMDSCRQRM